jgi:hypothetical protein
MTKKNRDYQQERKTAIARKETGVGSSSGDATRHRARRLLAKTKDIPDGHEVDHKRTLKDGGSNSNSNLRVRSVKANRAAGGKSGSREGKAAGGRKAHSK